jgi:hypothetical protein
MDNEIDHANILVSREEDANVREHALVDRFRLLREKSKLGAWVYDDDGEVEVEDDIIIVDDIVNFESVDTSTNSRVDQTATTLVADNAIAEVLSSDVAHSVTTLDDVTYITARPHGFRGVVAALTRRRLRLAGMSERPDVMLGNIGGLLGNKRIAKKKFTNFAEFSMLFPEYDFVLCGDSGQGDAALGMLMQEHYPKKVRGVYIHNINKNDVTGDGELKSVYEKEKNFEFFQTYVGSAAQAYRVGLIDGESLVRVARATLDEFVEKKFPKNLKGKSLKSERLEDLKKDLSAAMVFLVGAGCTKKQ